MTDLSLLSLFWNAGPIVKLVMLLLFLASIFSWSIILGRTALLAQARKACAAFEKNFWSGIELSNFYQQLHTQKTKLNGLEAIFFAGFKEYLVQSEAKVELETMLHATERQMRIQYAKQLSVLEDKLSLLATIQSTSPYVGLFGTVWGIMHSFKQLGSVQQATLAMVAPGISEALVATAMGLIAAIPAGIAYNRYLQQTDHLGEQYNIFIEQLLGLFTRKAVVGAQSA